MGTETLKYVISLSEVGKLLGNIKGQGFHVVGPVLADGAIIYDTIHSIEDLPSGYQDEQEGGHYRLKKSTGRRGERDALFRYTVGPSSWKRFLFPPEQKLWKAVREGKSFSIESPKEKPPRYAFFGVRPCEVSALKIQDKVFCNNDFQDKGYAEKRKKSLVIAVNCTRSVSTCFCRSMDTGPKANGGFDLALTEISDGKNHRFIVEVGSKKGSKLLKGIDHTLAERHDLSSAAARVNSAKRAMKRQMPKDAAKILSKNSEHPHWKDVAARCLNCANCTMVCPTCFCSTVEDTTSLSGDVAERWRRWDSCFTVDFSYIHGGPIRRDSAARYRQWLTHKLSSWHDQFGTSGCTGCGRCITWCPVGIDITEEIKALQKGGK
ncbi:MAG: 4Fe-4S dicluster domain-containing protein [Rhodospirillales bacterium]|nr:4Fe-4S dicluster domain-containing protein [Rhodospirillales bacterium]